jgi:hypothetical protein
VILITQVFEIYNLDLDVVTSRSPRVSSYLLLQLLIVSFILNLAQIRRLRTLKYNALFYSRTCRNINNPLRTSTGLVYPGMNQRRHCTRTRSWACEPDPVPAVLAAVSTGCKAAVLGVILAARLAARLQYCVSGSWDCCLISEPSPAGSTELLRPLGDRVRNEHLIRHQRSRGGIRCSTLH